MATVSSPPLVTLAAQCPAKDSAQFKLQYRGEGVPPKSFHDADELSPSTSECSAVFGVHGA